MLYISNVLRSVFIIILFSGADSEIISSERSEPSEQTIEAIKKCMDRSPAPWLNGWKKEYIDTIHRTIELHRDTSHYAERLEIFVKGFKPYWDGLKKTKDKSLFEVHQAQIRWYIEHLMSAEFPIDQERQKLRDQYTDIWDYAADSLLEQFPLEGYFPVPLLFSLKFVEHFSDARQFFCRDLPGRQGTHDQLFRRAGKYPLEQVAD